MIARAGQRGADPLPCGQFSIRPPRGPMPHRYSLLPFLRWLPQVSVHSLGRDAVVGLTGAI
ncbi:hypothetical protein NG726_36645, partial [Pseudomonas sp. MOB-449]|nr:hypothetical protein [Pseudomonas sp. MOB-449]